jgi:hypothetical protein
MLEGEEAGGAAGQVGNLSYGEHGLAGLLGDILSGVHTVEATIEVSGPLEQPEWSLVSNLGPQVSQGLNQALARELTQAGDELASRVESETRGRLSAFATLVNAGFRDSSSELDLSETAVRRLFDQVGGKPLDVRNLLRR